MVSAATHRPTPPPGGPLRRPDSPGRAGGARGAARPASRGRRTAALAAALPALAVATGTLAAQEEGDGGGWDVEESRAPSTTPLRHTATQGTWMSVDVSPDGTRMAFDLLGHIYEMPVDGGEARALTRGRSWNMFPRYSPDGGRLAFTSDRGGSEDLWILHLDSDSIENVSASDLPIVQPSWSADGRALYGTSFEQDAKTKGWRFNLHGGKQELVTSELFQPLGHFVEDTARGRLLYEHNDRQLHGSGARLKAYDLGTGETEVVRERPGGAFNPALSPDGRWLAYGHRDDQETVVVLHDLETREERVLVRGLDRDHQEYGPYYQGVAPNVDWGPDGRELFLAVGGGIRAVDAETGAAREIPFRAPVEREVDATIRFPVEVPEGTVRTRMHRWPQRTPAGIVYEALGDLWLLPASGSRPEGLAGPSAGASATEPRNLTGTPEHETSPAYDPATRTLYYAAWSDAGLGAVYRRPLDGGAPERLTDLPSQYGSLALSPDGRRLAFLRARGGLRGGATLEGQTDFELVVRGPDGSERRVADVSGTDNFSSRLPLTVVFGPDGERLYYTEFLSDTLTLRRIGADGSDRTTLYRFPHAVRAVPSPDLRWIAFREYHRSFVTPFEFVGKPVTVSAHDDAGTALRVDDEDGVYAAWSPDGRTLSWARGARFVEKPLEAILAGADGGGGAGDAREAGEAEGRGGGAEAAGDAPASTDLSVPFEVASPSSTLALTGVRVLTMTPGDAVLEDATILVEGSRIAAVGPDVEIPAGAEVRDLSGHTVMPGMIDSHGHYGSMLSQTNVVEQRLPGLAGALAHGVTTLYELYGTAEKDFWVSDMIREGSIVGPRLFSVGSPAYGLRSFRPKLYRPIDSREDALALVRYNAAVGATAIKDYVNFTREDRHRLTAAAREEGLNVLSETAGLAPMNFTQVVDGVTGLEHSMGLTPLYSDVVELFRASETGVTPTLLVVYNGPAGQAYFNQSARLWEDPKLLRFAREDQLRAFRRVTHFWPDDLYAPEMAAAMKRLQDAGTLVNMGGHGQMLGLDAHWELELMVQGGFSPMEAIRTATRNGAVYHGLDADLGTVEAGKLADLVVLSEDPREDIRNTRSIVYVMKHGVLYDGRDAARVFPDPWPAGPLYFEPRE